MIAFLGTCIYSIWMMYFHSMPFYDIFLSATTFLFHWYLYTGISISVLFILILADIFGMSYFFLGTKRYLWFGPIVSMFVGLKGSSSLTLKNASCIIMIRLLLIASSYLLCTSLISAATDIVVWNIPHLVLGTVLMTFAIRR